MDIKDPRQIDLFGNEVVVQEPKRRRPAVIREAQQTLVLYATKGNPGPPPTLTNGAKDTAPYQKHSATSKAAAKAIEPKLVGKRRLLLETMLALFPDGATDNQLIAHMVIDQGWSNNTARPRRIELVQMGYLEAGPIVDKSTRWLLTDRARAWGAEQSTT